MGLSLRVSKGDRILLERVSCERCPQSSVERIEKDGYVLEVVAERTQSMKEFVDFLKDRFKKDPESVIDFESLLIEYLKASIANDSDVKNAVGKILNRIKNISDGGAGILLRPFVLVRESSHSKDIPSPFKQLSFSKLALPIEEFVRYSRPFKADGIDSELVYATVSEFSERFFRMLDELICSLKGFEKYVEETVHKKGKKGTSISEFLERVMLSAQSELVSMDIDQVRPRFEGFDIYGSRIRPYYDFRIVPTGLPPSMSKSELEEFARDAVFKALKKAFAKYLEISEDEVEKYVDFSKVKVILNIRAF